METALKPPSLQETLLAGIKGYIRARGLRAGDRLGTEDGLARHFGVSRVSIREVTRTLGFLGILDSAPRRGLTLGEVDLNRAAEYLDFHFSISDYSSEALLRARVVIETGALPDAAKAMARRKETYEALAAINDAMRSVTDTERFIELDLAFHRGLLEASGIEPLVVFNGLLQAFFSRFHDHVVKARPRWKAGIASHARILNALRDGEVDQAQRLLRKHIEYHRGVL